MDGVHILASSLNFVYTNSARDLYFDIRQLTDRAAKATEMEICLHVGFKLVSDGGWHYLWIPHHYTNHNR